PKSGRIRYLTGLASLVKYFREVVNVDLSSLSNLELDWLITWAEEIRTWADILAGDGEPTAQEENRISVEAEALFHNSRHALRELVSYGRTADFDFEGNKEKG